LVTTSSRRKKKKSLSLLSNPLVGWKTKRKSDSKLSSATTTTTASELSSSSAVMFADPPTLSWLVKKVVTHEAIGTYKFTNWADHTLASTWKRAQSSSSNINGVRGVDSAAAPFSKVTLSKLLVLKDKATREDYFAQQAAFVMMEGRKDVRAEFATSIDVEGFRSKLLAVRPVLLHHRAASTTSSSSSKKQLFSAANIFFRQHIYLVVTLLGLSLPYRIWFAKHCDEIRITVVKETCLEESSSRSSSTSSSETEKSIEKSSWFPTWSFSGWGSSSSVTTDTTKSQELFRKSMSALSLYGSSSSTPEEEPSTLTTTVGTIENDRNETMIDEEASKRIVSSISESIDNTVNVAQTDSIPNSSSTKEQPPSLEDPISPPTS
jgi:hypothetical protein